MRLSITKYYGFLLCCLAAPLSLLAKDATVTAAQQRVLQRNNLHFTENKGQITDEHNKLRKDIQYKVAGEGMNVFVGNGQLHYQFNKPDGDKVNSYRMDVVLKGANTHAIPRSEEKQTYFERYLQPQFGKNGLIVNTYDRVVYKDIYPNIDWVLYIKDNQLEYDFVIHPGGNLDDIKLAYEGANKFSLDANGVVSAITPMGQVSEKTPYSYIAETGERVPSKFRLDKNVLAFEVSKHTGTLVIDPVINWGTYYGGTGTDAGRALAVDGSGNIFMAGTTSSANNIASNPFSHQLTIGGLNDAFLVQYNAAGLPQWGTYFGGAGNETGLGVATDASGNVVLVGTTNSTTGISGSTGNNNVYQTSIGSTHSFGGGGGGQLMNDAFVAKFSNSGALQWSTYLGGNYTDQANAVACDALGNVYVAGYTTSDSNVASSTSVYQDSLYGGTNFGDVMLAKFDATGNATWVTYFGSSTSDDALGIAVDAASNIYISGVTGSTDRIATPGAHQETYGGPANQIGDAFIAKFNTNGFPIWGTYYGGTGTENGGQNPTGGGITLDRSGHLYITGITTSSTDIASDNAFKTTISVANQLDAYLAKFDTAGNFMWGTYYGGTNSDYGINVSTDAQDNVYMVGYTQSTTGIATANAYQPTLTGFGSMLVEFNSLGQRLYGTYVNGTGGFSQGFAVANYTGTNPYTVMSGSTSATTGIATTNGHQTVFGGSQDAFLLKFSIDTNVNIKQPYTDTSFCAGGSFIVHDTTNFPFNAGNVFTVELSDATGSFATPVVIGTATATISGPISCTIPPATPAGTGYRIRITATNPAYTSVDDNVNITVVTAGITAPTVSYNDPLCVGDSLKFTVTPTSSLAPLTYSWTGPGGFTSSVQNATRANVTAGMAGTYSVTTTHAGCPSVTTNIAVTINSVIPAMPSVNANTPLCSGQTLNLSSSSTTSGVTYSWTGPNGYVSTLQNPTYPLVPVSAAGYYYVVAMLNGCRSFKDSINVVINSSASPVITIDPVTNDSVCQGSEANFIASIDNGGTNPRYQWYVNNIAQVGAISDIWGSPYLANGDQIYCIGTSNAGCVTNPKDTSNIIIVTILPNVAPTATITASPGNTISIGQGVTFTATVLNGGNNTTYQWQVNGTDVPGEIYGSFTSHVINDGDIVTVMVTSDAPCAEPPTVTSNGITMHVNVGVNQLSAFSEVSLYPNPSNGTVYLKGTLSNINAKEMKVEVLNAVGQMVYQQALTASATLNEAISLSSNMPDGVYMLRLSAGDESKVFRFTLQR